MRFAQLHQQTELLRRSLLTRQASHQLVPGIAALQRRLHEPGVAALQKRQHDEKERHVGFAMELRDFARNMRLNVGAD
jgi:hypothetical protein